MVTIGALANTAFERWTGTAPKMCGWTDRNYPDNFIVQNFFKPVQRKILFLSLFKILQGYAEEQDAFFDSDNLVYWTGRNLGTILVRKGQPGSNDLSSSSSSTSSLLDASSNNTNNALAGPNDLVNGGVVIDRTRGTLSHQEVYLCLASTFLTAAQARQEQEFTPFTTFPDEYDVAISFEESQAPHRRRATWRDIIRAAFNIADMVSRNRDGGKFAQLYGRVKIEGETLVDWKLQRGKPNSDSDSNANVGGNGTATANGLGVEGFGVVWSSAAGNQTVAAS